MKPLALLLVFAFILTPISANADDAASLLAKHKAYTGWQFGDPAMMSQEYTITKVGKDGKPLRESHVLRVGVIFRSDTQDLRANNTFSEGFTGNVAWYSDQNGFVVPIIGDDAKMRLAQSLFFSDGVTQLPWTLAGTVNKWNQTLTVVHVQHPVAGPITLYVDPSTGAYAGATFDPGGDNETTLHVQAYADVSAGKKVLSSWQFDDDPAHLEVSHVTAGGVITNDELHPPSPTASWDFKSSAPFPIKLTKDRIIVTARVNGVEGRFLLDSGASDIFFSGAFAHRAGIVSTGHADFYTLYGRVLNQVGQVSAIEIGGNALQNAKVYFGNEDFDADAPDGLLGFGVLAGVFLTVDFEHSMMQIQDPGAVDMSTVPGVHVAVALSDGQPVTPMFVQGKTATVNALLDTGSPREILIDESLPGKYGLHMTAAGVLGGCGLLDDMSLGPIVYDKPNACTVSDFGIHNALLGYDFLKGLSKLSFDYSKAALVLVPRGKP